MKKLTDYLGAFDSVIWDWNGTLLDDIDTNLSCLRILLEKEKLPVPSREQYRNRFSFPVYDYYKGLGFDFSQVSFADLAKDYIMAYEKNLVHAQLFKGTRDLLSSLSERGIKQFVLSAAEQNHLNRVLEDFSVASYFTGAYGLSDFQGESKVGASKRLIQDHSLDLSRTVLVGDTDHDLEVGKSMGVQVLLIADGHQSYDRLYKVHDQVMNSRYDE